MKVPSTSTNTQQIATVSHLVALAHQTHQTLSKTQEQEATAQSMATTSSSSSKTTTSIKTTKSCLTQPVQVQENPLEPLKACSATMATKAAVTGGVTAMTPPQLPTCTAAMTTNEIPAISSSSSANGTAVINNNNNNNHHHHPTLEVLADPQLQQQLEQVQQQTQNCENTAQTPTTPAADCGAGGVHSTAPASTSIMHKTQGASTSNATTITSISALSPQTPTVTTPSSAPLPHPSHTPNPPSAYASSQVTPVARSKHPQQQLSSISNPMHKVTKRKETLEAKRERKAAKTLAIITGAFVVCWLPFFAMALILPLCESCEINDAVASFFLWLGYFNSTLNPVIYTIFSPEFRQAFKRILFGGHRPVHYRSGKL
ncbi:5-hydroxytryptamine receptor 2A-like [Lucilia sericata]|uniref:5-hydroxytryptamine receptor 2A-like n=1 Tax=Lucilia sericata TaxID=13632 RepID=UPI0018A85072|nr:5-hydroxytryptamine receptor 2A-like [Lucilia sericata]